jgi:hypothetical protein
MGYTGGQEKHGCQATHQGLACVVTNVGYRRHVVKSLGEAGRPGG